MAHQNLRLKRRYYQYSRELRVDQTGVGDALTIKDACDMAAQLPRSLADRVLIRVNDGFYIEEPFEIPDYTTVTGISTHGQNVRNGLLISTQFGVLNPLVTPYFVKMNLFSGLCNASILMQQSSPANLAAEYSFIQADDWGILENMVIAPNADNYGGATPYYGINITKAGSEFLVDCCNIVSQGDGTFTVKATGVLIAYYSLFGGDPSGHLDLYHVDPNIKTDLTFCRMYSDLDFPGQKRPVDWVVRTATVNTKVKLVSTRVELNERVGPGTYQEMHPTTQQLSVAKRMNNRTILSTDALATRTADAYTDGTIECDSSAGICTALAPVYANVLVGQEFSYKRIGANNVVVDGNGVNIDGNPTHTIAFDNDVVTISKNDRGTWSLI